MPNRPIILVLAGVNGAGKSSVGGALLAEAGLTWFNPDTMAREIVEQMGMTRQKADIHAWRYGLSSLNAAIANGTSFAFETTLGGRTISLILAAAAATHDIIMIYCGLESIDLHIQRVAQRVASGGHSIPEETIRRRWTTSRANLIHLLPRISHLQVFDNSRSVPSGETVPSPILVLEVDQGRMLTPKPGDDEARSIVPAWARPIAQAAIDLVLLQPGGG